MLTASCSYPKFHFTVIIINNILSVDIDECSEGTSGCAQSCMNAVGNYSCSCEPGYLLASDEHTCDGQSL